MSNFSSNSNDSLRDGADRLGIAITSEQAAQLSMFADLLVKWNKTFNLVSRQDIGRLEPRHLLDSLAGLPLLRGTQVLDLGSGAGLPGIPLAICAPQRSFTLCDRSDRRTRFLQQVVRNLALANVDIWLGDINDRATTATGFDTVVARGVATAPVVWDMVQAHIAPVGCVLVYESTQSGTTDDAPPEVPQKDGIQISRHSYDIAGINQTHSILCMEST